ncbi:peptidase M13 [Nakamurella flava]|uniref:Peptidase M13 n=1 Tax=Nakamurella flava TaxID=2576308 RepID=A0A4U6QAI6_9ACTN|nr:M13-type metalloendopeptidase [Nakamurella flava]TKV56918.1 peptidase M13 [Nakamurella flava]
MTAPAEPNETLATIDPQGRAVAAQTALDPTAFVLDASTRAQDDLFRHVNGAWLATAEIPPDRPSDGSFYRLRDAAEADSRAIIEEAAADTGAAPGSPEHLIGALYRSFTDTAEVARRGLTPIVEVLSVVDAVDTPRSFLGAVGELRRSGVPGLFGIDIDSDPADPDQYAVGLWQGGIGLPDRSYYLDETHASVLTAYRRLVPEMFALAGLPDAQDRAARVIELETQIAQGQWDRVRSRDDSQTYNPTERSALDAILPADLWDAWLAGLQAPSGLLDHVIVRQPDHLRNVAGLLTAERIPVWRDWLRWNVLRALAPYGPDALVERNFDFYGRTLSGIPQLRERWKRGVQFVEGAAGEAVGRLYVQRHYPPAAKARMDELVENLIEAYRRDIEALSWMGPQTREQALAKLASFTPKIGYPERWRDYSALRVEPDDLIGNVRRATAFDLDRQFAKLAGPVDRTEWFMSPQTVNAYYNPGMNEIVFPAAILQPPFFDMEGQDPENYGAIGAVIGHEIGHGFDDQGSKFDGRGALKDWWTAEDRAAFERLTTRLIAQYDALEPRQTPGHHVNGALTVGENIGDLGGLGVAYQAWLISREKAGLGTPERAESQRFFLAWARAWEYKARDAEVLRLLAIDPHSPAEFRCNQVVRNLDPFQEAFDVQPGDGLWLDPQERVRIW